MLTTSENISLFGEHGNNPVLSIALDEVHPSIMGAGFKRLAQSCIEFVNFAHDLVDVLRSIEPSDGQIGLALAPYIRECCSTVSCWNFFGLRP